MGGEKVIFCMSTRSALAQFLGEVEPTNVEMEKEEVNDNSVVFLTPGLNMVDLSLGDATDALPSIKTDQLAKIQFKKTQWRGVLSSNSDLVSYAIVGTKLRIINKKNNTRTLVSDFFLLDIQEVITSTENLIVIGKGDTILAQKFGDLLCSFYEEKGTIFSNLILKNHELYAIGGNSIYHWKLTKEVEFMRPTIIPCPHSKVLCISYWNEKIIMALEDGSLLATDVNSQRFVSLTLEHVQDRPISSIYVEDGFIITGVDDNTTLFVHSNDMGGVEEGSVSCGRIQTIVFSAPGKTLLRNQVKFISLAHQGSMLVSLVTEDEAVLNLLHFERSSKRFHTVEQFNTNAAIFTHAIGDTLHNGNALEICCVHDHSVNQYFYDYHFSQLISDNISDIPYEVLDAPQEVLVLEESEFVAEHLKAVLIEPTHVIEELQLVAEPLTLQDENIVTVEEIEAPEAEIVSKEPVIAPEEEEKKEDVVSEVVYVPEGDGEIVVPEEVEVELMPIEEVGPLKTVELAAEVAPEEVAEVVALEEAIDDLKEIEVVVQEEVAEVVALEGAVDGPEEAGVSGEEEEEEEAEMMKKAIEDSFPVLVLEEEEEEATVVPIPKKKTKKQAKAAELVPVEKEVARLTNSQKKAKKQAKAAELVPVEKEVARLPNSQKKAKKQAKAAEPVVAGEEEEGEEEEEEVASTALSVKALLSIPKKKKAKKKEKGSNNIPTTSKKKSTTPLATPRVNNSSTKGKAGKPVLQAEDQILFDKISSMLSKSTLTLSQKIEKDRIQREKEFSKVLAVQVERMFNAEMNATFGKLFDEKVAKSVADAVRKGVRADIKSSLKEPFKKELQTLFLSSLAPTIESSCKTLFMDIDKSFQSCVSNHTQTVGVTDNVQKLTDAVSSLSLVCNTMVGTITQLASMKGQMSMNGGGYVGPSLLEVIDQHIIQDEYDDAVTKAVQAQSVEMVQYVIAKIGDPNVWLASSTPSPAIILALLQQLGADLHSDLETSIQWIKFCLPKLSPSMGKIMGDILTDLCFSLEAVRAERDPSCPLSFEIQFIISFAKQMAQNSHI